MRQLVQYDLNSGSAVFLDIDELGPRVERIARNGCRGGHYVRVASARRRHTATQASAEHRPPHQIEVESGIRLNAKVDPVTAAPEGEGHFRHQADFDREP
jgi:hypothetical protein